MAVYLFKEYTAILIIYNMRKPLSNAQIVLLTLLWVAICFIILTGTPRIDGPQILTLIISGALVFIPIAQSIKSRRK